MWFGILSIIAIVLFYFLRDYYRLNKEMRNSGGMRVKYDMLITLFAESDSRTQIFNETPTSIMIGVEVRSGFCRFELVQGFDVLVVTMNTQSNIFGKSTLQWQFKDRMDQEEMFEKICLDMEKVNSTVGI